MRRHHLVSAFYLRGFADHNGRLVCSPRNGDQEYRTTDTNATVQTDFYTLTDANGVRSEWFEEWMGEVESDAAPVLRSLVAGEQPPPVGQDRLVLAGWVALLHLRGEAQRRMLTQFEALLEAVQRASAIDDMKQTMGHAIDQVTLTGRIDPSVHVQVTRDLMPAIAARIMSSSWRVLHLSAGSLVVGDHPVGLIPTTESSPDRGTGLANAAMMLPLSRGSLLIIDTPRAGDGLHDSVDDADAETVRLSNLTVILNARRAVYRHPEDPLPEPMSSFPPARHVEVAFEQVAPARPRPR